MPLLVGLRAADRQGVRGLGLEISDLECGRFRYPEQAIRHDGEKGGIP